MADIESLELQIKGNASGATRSVNTLIATLDKLEKATAGGCGLSAVTKEMGKFKNINIGLSSSTKNAGNSFGKMATQVTGAWLALRKTTRTISSWINESNDYVEAHNLFTASMGEYAASAQEYAEKVSDVMGVDPSTWMKSQGVFMTLATGFGVAGDRAAVMSQQLTQLGYDLSSFFNIPVEESMQKLKSGLSGELEPLRNLGYDLSKAKLEAIALSLGIDKTYDSMNQAEKSQLRYYAIMSQVTTAQGDMARTLEAPANQLRILKSQVEQTARALGNIFIPILNAVLPYLIAAVKVVRILANAIASLVGFTMPEIDYSGLENASSGAGAIGDAFEDAAEGASKLNKATLGIDELNVLSDSSSGSGSGPDVGGSGFDFDLPTYDFIGDATNSRVNEIVEKMKEWLGITGEIDSWSDLFNTKLGTILTTVGLIGAGFVAWKIGSAFMTALDTVTKIANSDFGAAIALLKEGNSVLSVFSAWFPGISSAISTAATAVGSFVSGISAPVWATIGVVIAGIAAAAVFLAENWDAVTAAVKRFFEENIEPKFEEIKGHFDDLVTALGPIIELIGGVLEGLWESVKNVFDRVSPVFEALGGVFEAIGGAIVAVVGGAILGAFDTLVGIIENAMETITGIVKIVSGVIEGIEALLTGGDIGEAWDKIWDGVVDVVSGLWGLIFQPISDFIGGIVDFFLYLWDELVGHSIVPDTINAIVEWFTSLPGKIFKSVQDFVDGIVTKFTDMWDAIKTWWTTSVAPKLTLSYWKGVFANVISGASSKLGEMTGKISEIWAGVKSWFNTNVAPKLTLDYWKGKFANIAQGIKDVWNTAKAWWDKNKPSLATVQAAIASVKDKLSSAWTTAKEWWNNKKAALNTVSAPISSIYDKISGLWTTARTWWNTKKAALNTISFSMDSIKTKIKNAWDTAKAWLDKQSMKLNIKMPHISVSWNYDISDWQATIANFLFDKKALPKIGVEWYAQGGFPGTDGQLFVANEAGPELVGRIGNRNAVVNNDQIVAAVSEGVYAAVVAAMKSSSGQATGQAVNVYLDGKQITATVEQRQRERGATIMGGQVYSY